MGCNARITGSKPVTLKPDAHLHHEQFDVMAV